MCVSWSLCIHTSRWLHVKCSAVGTAWRRPEISESAMLHQGRCTRINMQTTLPCSRGHCPALPHGQQSGLIGNVTVSPGNVGSLETTKASSECFRVDLIRQHCFLHTPDGNIIHAVIAGRRHKSRYSPGPGSWVGEMICTGDHGIMWRVFVLSDGTTWSCQLKVCRKLL